MGNKTSNSKENNQIKQEPINNNNKIIIIIIKNHQKQQLELTLVLQELDMPIVYVKIK